jgi:hypothetical protein
MNRALGCIPSKKAEPAQEVARYGRYGFERMKIAWG